MYKNTTTQGPSLKVCSCETTEAASATPGIRNRSKADEMQMSIQSWTVRPRRRLLTATEEQGQFPCRRLEMGLWSLYYVGLGYGFVSGLLPGQAAS